MDCKLNLNYIFEEDIYIYLNFLVSYLLTGLLYYNLIQVDPIETFNKLSEKLVDMTPIPGTFMGASFGHLAGGYDARYYGYLVRI